MIRFFRKIRIKLLPENKLAKYFIYAFGEVLITVIGIMIAIQINNWNQQRLEEIKINRLLLEIQNNLEGEIESARTGIELYNRKDTLMMRIMEGKVTREEFNSPPITWGFPQSPQYATSVYFNDYSLNKNAYNNLVQISDKIPQKYLILFRDVTDLYEDTNDWVRQREEKLLENYYECQNYFRDNKAFMSDLWTPKPLDDAAIDFFMYDPIYMNWIHIMHHYYMEHQKSIIGFVEYATKVRNEILELELEEEL
jgi:hypothetical protein